MLKNVIIVAAIIAIGVLTYFLLQKPEPIETVIPVPIQIEVPIPPKEGKSDTIYLPSPIKENPINKELEKKLKEAKDSLELIKIVKEELKEREYKEVFEDSVQSVTVTTKTQGKLLSQSLEYQIRGDTMLIDTLIDVKVPIKNRVKVFGHMEVGNSFDITEFDPTIKTSIIIKNRKDNLLSIGADSKKRIWIGGGFKF